MFKMFKKITRLSGPWLFAGWCITSCALIAGCGNGLQHSNSMDRFGRTYYLDGAGNWGFGVLDIQNGLRRAGYKGNIINYRWSQTLNPALDQTAGRPFARLKGADLGNEITAYQNKYPNAHVNIIALSAGTGVAVWACEHIKPPAHVYSLIMLGSSLSSTYDMSKALRNISNGVWVYHSLHDRILQGPVRILGTIDGEMGIDSAGLVGLHPRSGSSSKIHNIRWSARYERYGWSGAHTDATSEPFVRLVLAKHILSTSASSNDRLTEQKMQKMVEGEHQYTILSKDISDVGLISSQMK